MKVTEGLADVTGRSDQAPVVQELPVELHQKL